MSAGVLIVFPHISYQINARTELAVRYNDISPLENHHCAVAFQIISQPEYNIFSNVDQDQFKQIRQVWMLLPSVSYKLFLKTLAHTDSFSLEGRTEKAPHNGRIQEGFLENFSSSTPWNALLRNNEYILAMKAYDILGADIYIIEEAN